MTLDSETQKHNLPMGSFASVCKVDSINTNDNFDSDDECSVEALDEIEYTLAVRKLEGYKDDLEYDVIDQIDLLLLPNQPRDGEGTLWADIRLAAYNSKMKTTQIDAILSAMLKHKAKILED